ncbi:cytochrome P450 3A14-like isoform X2 [Mercenaria mercenaria]|uniref:cytochrome P450 3A14-like isoform X2 n=1 Tax=Mercenaria mercenaria TaxID=6596 RepID=UPI00234FB0FA|nr:cytochrome P450 3A14-like isoform X2 [Mercenaria mercenaria]
MCTSRTDSILLLLQTMEDFDPWPMNKTLLSLKDEQWKRVRNIITPTFSAGKLKKMTKEINYCAELLTSGLIEKAKSGEEVDSRKHLGCYTMDVIAGTAFGIRTDAYNNPDDSFVSLAQKVFGQASLNPSTLLAILFPDLAWFLMKMFGISFFFPKDSLAFFVDVIKKIIKERQEKCDTERTDMLQLMMNAELQGETEDGTQSAKKLSLDELLGQGIIGFVAGYETTASLLTFMSYVLATHLDVQKKLLDEIDEHVPDGATEVSYDIVMEMPYLDQVINETLRMYPPITKMNRTTSKQEDVEIDGYWFPHDTNISYSIWQVHHCLGLYPEPEKFIPERFTSEEKAKRDPFVFMPFGHGPRNCIGMRLALLEAKIATVAILRKLKFVKCAETEENLQLIKGTFLKPKNPIKVGVVLR